MHREKLNSGSQEVSGSIPLFSTKENLETIEFMFIGTQCDLWGKPDGTGQQRSKVRTYSFYLASLYCYHYPEPRHGEPQAGQVYLGIH